MLASRSWVNSMASTRAAAPARLAPEHFWHMRSCSLRSRAGSNLGSCSFGSRANSFSCSRSPALRAMINFCSRSFRSRAFASISNSELVSQLRELIDLLFFIFEGALVESRLRSVCVALNQTLHLPLDASDIDSPRTTVEVDKELLNCFSLEKIVIAKSWLNSELNLNWKILVTFGRISSGTTVGGPSSSSWESKIAPKSSMGPSSMLSYSMGSGTNSSLICSSSSAWSKSSGSISSSPSPTFSSFLNGIEVLKQGWRKGSWQRHTEVWSARIASCDLLATRLLDFS